MSSAVLGQRPYIGFAYPAGGQQGTTFRVKLAGQSLENLNGVVVSGAGVTARVVEYLRPLDPISVGLLYQQVANLRKPKTISASPTMTMTATASGEPMMMSAAAGGAPVMDRATPQLITKLEKRISEYCIFPTSDALRSLAFIEVTIAPDAPPGERELRLVTLRGGASNPLPFHVGQLPEYCRKPMFTSPKQILGKENLALRKRPETEVEDLITVPCTVNGQIASGETNRYRFEARKGQRLVITTLARELIPYIADAVPGWFQPVLTLYDGDGKELTYNDDYRFKPDPMVVYEIPKDGEYVFAITDAIFRGREDFIYRITIGETPFVTSIFPLGGRVGEPCPVKMTGMNIEGATLTPPADTEPGIQLVAANKKGLLSNWLPFALDTLPEIIEKENNDTPSQAQHVTLPVNINGRIGSKGDWDVFQFQGKAGDTVVAEVMARRLDSPMDSIIKLADAKGQLVALSDDVEDLGSGVNTHHADSYFMTKLPADGLYYIHIGEAGNKGGEEYGYRLRISAPRPDFELRTMTSSTTCRQKNSGAFTVFALRKDGFNGPIKLAVTNAPAGFTPYVTVLASNKNVSSVSFKADIVTTNGPVNLTIVGIAKIDGKEIIHKAVPSEDRMQAFLWRHLVPSQDLKVLVFDPAWEMPPKYVAPDLTPSQMVKAKAVTAEAVAAGRTITKNQVAGRMRQLKLLYEEGLFTTDFYCDRAIECGDPQ
jgi:hypothetical protein